MRSMFPYTKIVFVSTSNICRGPWAEHLFEKEKLDDIEVDSKGTVVLFAEPMNPKAVAIAKTRQIDMEDHCAMQLQADDFGEDILILTMTANLKSTLYEEYAEAKNVYTLKEFVGEEGDLLEPVGGELTEYGEVFEIMERLIHKLAHKIQEVIE